ncbi:hypothetical protein [Methylobacter sp.]|uniref:hypothetical protein n=1 Tax=Methylobacter sp. TaxID=2051955 RepID=UPI00122A3A1F|nr:hypothetical protein [Methylobacter sp.]TAK61261.1 MAG: hypothetical protein EPO18_14530 [Methylobacter sp.]
MTKNDIYAFLIALGVNREYAVIPEFSVKLPGNGKRKKVIDLVWAKKKPNTGKITNTLDQWQLVAAFEIEGCNVPREPEFSRHLSDFKDVKNFNGKQPQKYVVLYTNAYDRTWNSAIDIDKEINTRVTWGATQNKCFKVLDGRKLKEASKKFPPKVTRKRWADLR